MRVLLDAVRFAVHYWPALLIAAGIVFALSLGLAPWQTWIVAVGIDAAVVLGVIAWYERVELKAEREYSAELHAWIEVHHPATPFAPYEGDEVER